MGINKFILQTKNPLKSGLLPLPIFYGITLFDNVFSIVHEGPKLLRMDKIAIWLAFVVSAAACIAVAILVQFIIVPWQRRKILGQNSNGKLVTFGDSDAKSSPKRTDNAESDIGLNRKLLNDNNVNTNMSTNSSKALSSVGSKWKSPDVQHFLIGLSSITFYWGFGVGSGFGCGYGVSGIGFGPPFGFGFGKIE